MNSGWWKKADGAGFRNADANGGMNFPGFHAEAAMYLAEHCGAVGIGVDTLSLDPGNSKDFSTHYQWLPSNRWGLECLTNLGELPPTGATIVVGAPKIAGATGGPSRVFALV
jgi:kynurenine formamidase